MQTIGLIAAMKMESAALLRRVKEWKPVMIGQLRGQRFELAGNVCLLVTSGMGVRRAGEAARSLADRYSPGVLVSFGIAGAVEADLEIGDVVLADVYCQLDEASPGTPTSLAAWPGVARQAAETALTGMGRQLLSGTAVTTGGSQVDVSRLAGLRHPILEMETAGIAQLAMEKGLPLLSLRAISDGPCAPLPFDLGEMMDKNANLRASRLLKTFLLHPRILFQSLQMRQNSIVAADCAGLALLSALSQLPGEIMPG